MAVQAIYPKAQVTIGPVIEDGFYLRLRVRAPVHARGSREVRGQDEGNRRGRPQGHAARHGARRRRGAVPEHGREVQGRDHRQHSRRTSRSASTARASGSTCAAARTCRPPASSRLQAHEGRRRLLARRFAQRDAPAHLRHGLAQRQGSRGLPASPRGGREARSSPHRQGPRPVPFPGGSAGRGVLAPEGLAHLPAADRLHAQAPGRSRLRRGERAGDHGIVAVGRSPATSRSSARTCS